VTESTEQGQSAALAAKMQVFVSTLPPEEAAQLQRIVQALRSEDAVQGYALDTAPAASGWAAQLTQELPEALVDKVCAFAGNLAPAEQAALQSVEQPQDGEEVQGYLGTVIPSQYNNLTYGQAFTILTFAAQTGVYIGPK
jgi:hypothetical protein